MKKVLAILLAVLLLAPALACAEELAVPSLSQSTAIKLEGSGFHTPEEAVLAYLEGLNRGDATEMLSTFAIESYVDNMDAENYLSRARSYGGFSLIHTCHR